VSGSKFVEGARIIVIISELNKFYVIAQFSKHFWSLTSEIGNENKNVLRRLLGLEMESCCPPQKKPALGGGDVV
jgi:hypothetical protein